MTLDLIKFLKKRKENYIRNWKEQENLEKYGGILFILIIIALILFSSDEQRKRIPFYINILSVFYLTIVLKRIKKTKRELSEKNREVEQQKSLLEEKQKEIIDSINYAKRIQKSQLPTDIYIEKNLKRLKKS